MKKINKKMESIWNTITTVPKGFILIIIGILFNIISILFGEGTISILFFFVGNILVFIGFPMIMKPLIFAELSIVLILGIFIKFSSSVEILSNYFFSICYISLGVIFIGMMVYKLNKIIKDIHLVYLFLQYFIFFGLMTYIFAVVYNNGFSENFLIYNDALHTRNFSCNDTMEYCANMLDIKNDSFYDMLYYSGLTISTIGSGEIIPYGNLFKFFTIFESFLGSFLLVAVFSLFVQKRLNT